MDTICECAFEKKTMGVWENETRERMQEMKGGQGERQRVCALTNARVEVGHDGSKRDDQKLEALAPI